LSWCVKDPEAAFLHAKTLPAGDVRENAIAFAFTKWAEKDPANAIGDVRELLAEFRPGLMGNLALNRIVATGPRRRTSKLQ
jgi:hypothetical protein